MKNTTAQNVDPDRVEMASGYRMKTRPAPGRNIRGLVTGWKCRWERQVGGGPRPACGTTQRCVGRENQGPEDDRQTQLQLTARPRAEEVDLRRPDQRVARSLDSSCTCPPPVPCGGSSVLMGPTPALSFFVATRTPDTVGKDTAPQLDWSAGGPWAA